MSRAPFSGIIFLRDAQKVAHALPRRFEESRGAGLHLGGRIDFGRFGLLCHRLQRKEEECHRRDRERPYAGGNQFSERELLADESGVHRSALWEIVHAGCRTEI